MNSRQRVLNALRLEPTDRVPFCDAVDDELQVKIMGRPDFDDADLARKLGLDGLISSHNIYATPTCARHISENGRSFMGHGLIRDHRDLSQVKLPDSSAPGFFDELERAVEKNGKAGLPTITALYYGATECVIDSMGLERFSIALYDNLGFIETLLELYIEYYINLIGRLNAIGVDCVVYYDNFSYNTGPMISPNTFREIFLPREKQLGDTFKIPWVLHMDGNISQLMPDLLPLGMNGLHPIQDTNPQTNLKDFKARYGDVLCLWGNVNIERVLATGSPEDVKAEVRRCFEQGAQGGGYIIGSSNSLVDFLPLENVLAMADSIRTYPS